MASTARASFAPSSAAMSLTDVMHLFRRAGFGATETKGTPFVGRSRSSLVDEVVVRGSVADITPPVMRSPSGGNWDQWVAATQAWLDQMVATTSPLAEKMALFWHGHFVSGNDKIYDMPAMWEQIDLFRRAGMGSFRQLARAASLTPAMLFYLDNWQNIADAPNENFARELLELFLLGPGQYTEADVVAVARAWTGHTVDPVTRRYAFRADWHDSGLKTFLDTSATYDGPGIIDAVLDHPSKRRACAAFLARKLWTYFAYPGAPDAVVADLVGTLLASDWDIASVLRALFLRDEFYAPDALDGLVRSPVEWCVVVARAASLSAADLHPEWLLPAMGQQLFAPPNVAGWGSNRYWISTTAAAARADHARYAAWKASTLRNVFAETLGMSVPAAVAAAFAAFGVDRVSAESRARVSAWLTQQRAAPFTEFLQPQNLFSLVAMSPETQLA